MDEETVPENETLEEKALEDESAPRVQRFDGDVIVETTEQQPVKRRISEQELLRKQAYLTNSIAAFQTELEDVSSQLTAFYETTGDQTR